MSSVRVLKDVFAVSLALKIPQLHTATVFRQQPTDEVILSPRTNYTFLRSSDTRNRNEHLQSGEFFLEPCKDEITSVTCSATLQSFRFKEVVFRQGDEGSDLFVVDSGCVRIIVNGKPVHTVKEGGFFGERSLVHGELRAATVEVISEQGADLWPISQQWISQFSQSKLKAVQLNCDRLL